MITSKKVLTDIFDTVQSQQHFANMILGTTICTNFRQTLNNRNMELNAIENEAHILASQRGWELEDLQPAEKYFQSKRIRRKLRGCTSDTYIAEMLICDMTDRLNQGLRALHQWNGADSRIRILSQKLIDCENAGIRQLQQYL